MASSWYRCRKRIYEIIEVGFAGDRSSRLYDLVNSAAIIVNLTVSILRTFQELEKWAWLFLAVEEITVAFFAADYLLRLWTARFLHPALPEGRAVAKYVFSFIGIVDLLSFLPHYLPIFSLPGQWPSGCSGWYGSSGCSKSTPIMTPSASSPRSSPESASS